MNPSSRPALRQQPTETRVMLLLLLAHLGVLCLRVGAVLTHPSEFILTPGGDGIKTYFSLLYYVHNDTGLHFSGMSYPYGDLFLYTDGFPLLAWVLKAWKAVFGLTMTQSVAVLNYSVLLASLPASPLVYLIVRRSGVGQWFGALAALVIALLSPQFFRLQGHLTLALPFVVPLLWYLQLRLAEAQHRRGRLGALAAYVLATVLLGVVHPYYLLHAVLLPVATAGVQALQQLGRQRQWWQGPAWLLAAGVLPLALFQGTMALLDSATDRPVNPYGFFVYLANPASVFGPVIEPFAAVFKFVFHTADPIWEGYAYVGLPVVLGLGLWLGRAGRHLWRRQPGRVFRPVLPPSLRATVWAAVPILLFAMGWPFIFETFTPLADHLGPIKQFRSLGRFAWIFYYVAAVLATTQYWQLYRYLRQRRAAWVGQVLLGSLLVVWVLEAKYQLEAITRPIHDNRVTQNFIGEEGNYTAMLAQVQRRPSDFQAVLPLPYYSIGSEKFDLSGSHISMFEGFRASLNLRLPLAAAMMARAQVGHLTRLLQLFSSPLTPKPWVQQLPSRKPLLVLASRHDSLRTSEKALLTRGARLLVSTDRIRLYELPLSAFDPQQLPVQRAAFVAQRDALPRQGELWRTAPGAPVVWDSFAQQAAPDQLAFTRPGAVHQAKGAVTLYDAPLPGALPTDTATYELSVWTYGKTDNWLPLFAYRQFAPDGTEVESRVESMKSSTEISRDWVQFSVIFRLQNPANRITVSMDGTNYIMDDLLIRPRTTNVYWLDQQGQPVFNGFPLYPGASAEAGPQ